jgi:NAD(P)-dependent dehydrogenase (short-subunit alcohol dehydrogenase family)
MRRLSDKTAVVTGGTAGIGFHTAAALADQGARGIVTGRHFDRGYAAVKELRRIAGHERVLFLAGDASSISENRRLTESIARRCGSLDILVNNVGGVYADRRETREGIEATLALNFLAPFVLTEGLLSLLHRSRGGRIVNVVSCAFQMV